jgi:ABC-type antimicrobial peptide transport system permease subunit
MSTLRFITASLRHYRRVHLAVAMGVAVATAVLTGALLVGDSLRGSLRDLTLERLGRVDSALATGQMFREALADELAADAEFQTHFAATEPAILLSGTLQSGSGESTRRATAISVIGCRPTFWSLGQGSPQPPLDENEVALSESVARELGVEPGGIVLLRVPTAGAIPADSPLGEKNETAVARPLKVREVLPPNGMARFSLMPSQQLPRNAFTSLRTLQKLLDEPGKANAILVVGDDRAQASNHAAQVALAKSLKPKLEDYGVHIEHLPSPVENFNVYQIAADQLVLPNAIVSAFQLATDKKAQPIVTYLANTISKGEGAQQREIPYSTITGVDSEAGIGPLVDDSGAAIVLADDEIALNRWATDDLHAELGDEITVTFYEPESTHGVLREHEPAPRFKLRAIVELENAEGRPTTAADPKLTPELPGVTDQESINDWELPFELVERIRQQDEDYWDKYRTTPKAFVSLATAKRLWSSRWGTISLMRFNEGREPVDRELPEVLENWTSQALDPSAMGMTFIPVKQLGLAASSGTTPFEGLFLGFSLFLIAAALMLIALLFQLGVHQRTTELGTLAAVGIDRARIARLLSREALVVAVVGASAGIVLGILYAWLMIFGLRTLWLAAISTPFIALHVSWLSLLIGWLIGIAVSWLTIRISVRRVVRQPANRLLAGVMSGAATFGRAGSGPTRVWPWIRATLLLLIAGMVVLGYRLQGEAQAGVFFGSGAAVLTLLLGEVSWRLRHSIDRSGGHRTFSLWDLSALNTARNPGRSTLTIGLVSAASFLIVAISAFRLDTSDEGSGGFDYLASSDQPIHFDLNTSEGRFELGFSDAESQQLAKCQVYSLRVASGEDASCLNLYRPTQPRVLGVPDDFVRRGGFEWSATADSASHENPWRLLHDDIGSDDRNLPIVPVVLDASTAAYSLHLKGVGSRMTIRDAADKSVTLQVVGLLKNSVLQGSLLVSEERFLQMFPDAAGYGFFLIDARGSDARRDANADGTSTSRGGSVPTILESRLGDVGLDVVDAREQLAAFLAVQNTYLSTFQSLGALGLLLGTVGLAVVQLRSVLERRAELALMRVGGFPRARLVRMVVGENAVLLLGGLVVGCLAAAVALVPQWAPRQASIPWQALAAMLGAIAVVGLAAGWLATRSALRAPLLPALRGD